MSGLFEIKPVDRKFYEEKLKNFLPDQFIDIHTHIWLDRFKIKGKAADTRCVTWPSRVALDNSAEDLDETYHLMFPGKKVTPLVFGTPANEIDLDASNNYVAEKAAAYHWPSLLLTIPEESGEEVKRKILAGGFLGTKVYLNYAPAYIPQDQIRIFDFLPHHQLKTLNDMRAVVMLHIPRDQRLKDPVNHAQILEICRKYPDIKLIIAHVGRAYCNEDLGNSFEVLAEAKNLMFDFCANTNRHVFECLIKAVGPRRILFGSDMPILRMRTCRISENGKYINLVPRGLYGDVSADSHLREVDGKEADALSFFMYEEIDAFRLAATSTGLDKKDIEDIFYNNAKRILGDW